VVVAGGGAAEAVAGADVVAGADDGAGGGGGVSVLGDGEGDGVDVTVTVSVGGGDGGASDVGGRVGGVSFHTGAEGVVVVGAAWWLVRLGRTNIDTEATRATAARIAATPTIHGQRGGIGGAASYSAAGLYVS